MMEVELSSVHRSQQDMNLIDILWRQDIDLGAEREVFDLSLRQKEDELRRQRELEEEKRLHLLREQDKALLEQLELDEETGEFMPCLLPSEPELPNTHTTPEGNQNTIFSRVDGDALSFDECMQLLVETFPLVETIELPHPPPAHVMPSPFIGNSRPDMLTSQQSPVAQNPMLSALLAPHKAPTAVPASLDPAPVDVEQAWMELLSLPELEQHLKMQVSDILDQNGYTSTSMPLEVQDPNYSFYLPELPGLVTNIDTTPPVPTINNFKGMVPPDNLNQITLKAPELNTTYTTDSLCKVFYTDPSNTKPCSPMLSYTSNEANPQEEVRHKPLESSEIHVPQFSLTDGHKTATEFPDSDSGLSMDNVSSPKKSHQDDSSTGYSDSDLEEMDSNRSEYREMFSLSLHGEEQQSSPYNTGPVSHLPADSLPYPKSELIEGNGHNQRPFTKDKPRRRYAGCQSRLSRDEQRAKALGIPFAVELIINLPVDDFNELMSKHQLNEVQLVLIRDIRRRGKNKVAAQNCRKRKMESISDLEGELEALYEKKEHLLRESAQRNGSLNELKEQLGSLYLEVFSRLRDEEGKPYSPSDYSLQQTSNGSMFLVPRVKKILKGEDK
ncbi:nuclear factor erythroid 2-related factor 2-like isoform X1 [Salvelinus fontinalis]|uniref:nuclear factor erythroid 2-related factor 2-like isoform X1 n=2 Tax=Salvelinus fontinalis TaxID=8038 RepID=UPI002485F1C3|nr:nuclear factor erythroid 2-related factor 2-like isoform X1 [Salvelinus fontinalis]